MLNTAKGAQAVEDIQNRVNALLAQVETYETRLRRDSRKTDRAFFAMTFRGKKPSLAGLGVENYLDFPWMQTLQIENLTEDMQFNQAAPPAIEPLPQGQPYLPEGPVDNYPEEYTGGED